MPCCGEISKISRIGVEELSVEWRIKKFLSLPCGIFDFYDSPRFKFCNARWSLRLYPNVSHEGQNSASVTLDLIKVTEGPPKTFKISVGIRGSSGMEMQREAEKEFTNANWYCEWKQFCWRSEMVEHKTRLMPDNILAVTCIIKTSGDARVIEQLKEDVEALVEQNMDLNGKCEEQTHNISKASSELKKARMDNELHKKEMESLMEQIKVLKKTVENYQTQSENYTKQMSILESELISSEKRCKNQDKLTNASGLGKDSSTQTDDECKDSKSRIEESISSEKQASFGDDAEERNNENNDDEGDEESKHKKKLSQIKNTKKISLPTRHGDVISSLRSILAEGRRADFTLKSAGGREWPVHRAILEGRSGHFATMFRGEWANTDEAQFDDVTEGALDGVLHFMYAGEVADMSVESVCGIYVTAQEFLLEDLKSLCVEYMKEKMCPEIGCIALAISEASGERDLKQSALECFFRESNRTVATEGWQQLKENHPEIIGELFEEFIKRKRKNQRKEQD